MLDLTSNLNRFHRCVAEGNLYAAIGVRRGAKALDIDVAAAQLAEGAPSLVQEINAIANLLTHRQRRAEYDAVLAVRDQVRADLKSSCGDDFAEQHVSHDEVWARCCGLFRYDPWQSEEIEVGPRGWQSLRRRVPAAVLYDLLAERLEVVHFTNEELAQGRGRRELWKTTCDCGQPGMLFCRMLAEHPTASDNPEEPSRPTTFHENDYIFTLPFCARCGSARIGAAEFVDRVDFALPGPDAVGQVARGESRFGEPAIYVLIEAVAGSPIVPDAVNDFFARQAVGEDATLEEIEGRRECFDPAPGRETDLLVITERMRRRARGDWKILVVVVAVIVSPLAMALLALGLDYVFVPRRAPAPQLWPPSEGRPAGYSLPPGSPSPAAPAVAPTGQDRPKTIHPPEAPGGLSWPGNSGTVPRSAPAWPPSAPRSGPTPPAPAIPSPARAPR